MRYTDVYYRTVDAVGRTSRFVSSGGGTRSGKTYSNLQIIYQLALMDKTPTITSVVSETFPHLKRGAIRDFRDALGDVWEEACWSKGSSIYELHNGSVIEFFSADAPAKVHGPARDRLFLNEAQNIPYETARQLFVRTKGLIIIDYNPVRSFWADQLVEPRDNCVSIRSTYKDNGFLTPQQVAEIEANRGDANWWRVYGEGKVGTLEGLIFPDFEQVDALPDADGFAECYGLDYGYTNDPTVVIRILIHSGRKELWLDELVYERGLVNAPIPGTDRPSIVQRLRENGVQEHGAPLFADSAEPKTNDVLAGYGWNVVGSYKGRRKAEQLQELRGWRLKVTKRSVNLIRELRGYTWQKDRDGNSLNEPIGVNDHAMDAFRYGAFTWLTEYAQQGVYSFGFDSDYDYYDKEDW